MRAGFDYSAPFGDMDRYIRFPVLSIRVAREKVPDIEKTLYDRAPSEPLPAFLLPLRATVAQWAGVDADALRWCSSTSIDLARPSAGIATRRSTT